MLQINASIARHKEKIWCAYRTKHLYGYDAECFLTELDIKFEPISDKRLTAENNNTAFEDVRLFSFGNTLLAFYTYFPFKEDGGWKWEYGVGFGEVDTETGVIKNQISLRGLSKRVHEKNWAPYNYNNELFMVTDFDPFLRVIKIENTGNSFDLKEIYLSSDRTTGWEFGELRGGTPLIGEYNNTDGWLYCFIHSYRTHEQGFNRYYYYTAARYNHLSKAFEYSPVPLPYIDEEPDEEYELLWTYSNRRTLKVIFPIGIMHHDNGVIVSFGKNDVSSHTEYFSWDHIKSLF